MSVLFSSQISRIIADGAVLGLVWWLIILILPLIVIAVFFRGRFPLRLPTPTPLHLLLDRLYWSEPDEPCSWVKLGRDRYLLLRDQNLITQVLATDFSSFPVRARSHQRELGVFKQEGDAWRRTRGSLTPSFTPAALRSALKPVREHATVLAEHAASTGSLTHNMLLAYCADCICSAIFAMRAEALADSPMRAAVTYMDATKRSEMRRVAWQALGDRFFSRLGLRAVPEDVSALFAKLGQTAVVIRRQKGVFAHDFVKQLNRKLTLEGFDEQRVKDEVSEQMLAVLSAGSSDSCQLLHHSLLELSSNPELQQRLRSDTAAAEDALSVPLLDEFLAEVLRLHPSEIVLSRECRSPCQLGPEQLNVGDRVLIPVWSLHRDPRLMLDSEDDREGDSTQQGLLQIGRKQALHLPFSVGPRMCVGYRLGLLQVKMAITELLKSFELLPTTNDTINLQKI